jgi:hypothetical protein
MQDGPVESAKRDQDVTVMSAIVLRATVEQSDTPVGIGLTF